MLNKILTKEEVKEILISQDFIYIGFDHYKSLIAHDTVKVDLAGKTLKDVIHWLINYTFHKASGLGYERGQQVFSTRLKSLMDIK